jgi:hypothetical protein
LTYKKTLGAMGTNHQSLTCLRSQIVLKTSEFTGFLLRHGLSD